jgi:hypothetical protein
MINGLAPYNLALAQMSEVWFNVVGNRAADRVQSAKDYEWMPPKEELDLYKRLSPSYVQWGRSDEGDVMVRWPYDLVPVTWWLGCEWQITDGVGGWVINRAGGTSYNTTDASIWACARLSLIWAVRYRSAVNKIKFVMELDKWAARNRV